MQVSSNAMQVRGNVTQVRVMPCSSGGYAMQVGVMSCRSGGNVMQVGDNVMQVTDMSCRAGTGSQNPGICRAGQW